MSVVLPSERELQALKILWRAKSATVRDVAEAFAARGDELAYTTVLTLLQVMEQKGLVGHTTAGKVYSYHPLAQRESTFRSLAKSFLNNVFDGALDEYVLHALKSQTISSREMDRLESLLAEAKAARKSGGKASRVKGGQS